MMPDQRLRITEIFYSLQGESLTVGVPTVFVRLTGCPLRCNYCDTEYAFTGGVTMTLDEILDRVDSYHARYVTVTGGEPLAQKHCAALLSALCDRDYRVSLETSGALDVSGVDARVVKVMDVKTPASGESDRNRLQNIDHLSAQDQVKFVISGRGDYEWSRDFVQAHALASKCHVLFSPVHARLEGRDLADWILQDRLPVRLQLQLHKLLWGDTPGK